MRLHNIFFIDTEETKIIIVIPHVSSLEYKDDLLIISMLGGEHHTIRDPHHEYYNSILTKMLMHYGGIK